jgi:hypothetical protein
MLRGKKTDQIISYHNRKNWKICYIVKSIGPNINKINYKLRCDVKNPRVYFFEVKTIEF